jgi:hypothetical protein
LKEGIYLTLGPLYACSEKELQTLKEYIKQNLANGFIWPLNLPVGFPVLFAPKKDRNLWVCVDYRTLNKITIPDRGMIPWTDESLDKIRDAKIFTAMDLIGVYNRVWIAEGDKWKIAF